MSHQRSTKWAGQLAEHTGHLELRDVDDIQPARAGRHVSDLLLAIERGAVDGDFPGLTRQRQRRDDVPGMRSY